MDDNFNASALDKRKTFSAFNDFSIQEMRGFPPYFGWVECQAHQNSFRMLLGGGDDGVALRFFWNGGYESTTLRMWSRIAKQTELALDVGAHTGVYTLAAKSANPSMNVASFEPHFMNFARLNLNLRANSMSTANSYLLAVGAKNEIRPFSVSTSPDYLTSGGALGTRVGATTTNVQVASLDNVIPDPLKAKVGLVKIDTEGAEPACIEGMRDILKVARPIIFFECIIEESGKAVENSLSKHGYTFMEVDDGHNTIIPVKAVAPRRNEAGKLIYGTFNRIAVPPGTTLPV